MPQDIKGVLPIAHTPFDERDEIDWQSLERQIDWALDQGADGFCTGMVSEILRLTEDERMELTRRLVDINRGRGTVIASVGAESTKQAVAFAREAERAGASGLMAIPPISGALPPEALLGYFRALAEEVALPLVIQDASAYVGQAIPMAVHIELLDEYGPDKILFKPEASPLGPKLSALRDATSGRARAFDGSGGISLVDSFRRGIVGTMPGMEFLNAIVPLWRALQQDDDEAIYRLYFPLCALVALQMQAGLDGFLAIEKYVLVKRGLFTSQARRQPYAWNLDAETRDEVDRLLARLEAAIAASA